MNTGRNRTIEIFNNTIRAFRQIKSEISKVKSEFQISKRQGIGMENAFAYKILEVIKNVDNDTYHGLRRPFLYFSDDLNDSFEKEKLILFIDNEIRILCKMEITNYLTVNNYRNKFENRLLTLLE